jgi:hypothetical protein
MLNLHVLSWTSLRMVFLDVCATVMHADVSSGSIFGAVGVNGNPCGLAASILVLKILDMTGVSPPHMGEAASDSAASLVAARRIASAC